MKIIKTNENWKLNIKILHNLLNEGWLDKEHGVFDYQTGDVFDGDYIDCSKTGDDSEANRVLHNPKEYAEEHGIVGSIVKMTPDEYFGYCGKLFDSSADEQKKQTSADRGVIQALTDVLVKYKKRFPIPYLNFHTKEQDGRHRMHTIGKLYGFETKVPVLVIQTTDNIKFPDTLLYNPSKEQEQKKESTNEPMQESKRLRKVQKSLYGDPKGKIKTFAIISPENPEGALGKTDTPNFKANYLDYLGDKDKGQFDGKTREELADGIRREGDRIFRISRLPYVRIDGEYDGREKSYLIFNLTPSDAFKIARTYGQESFFFGNVFEYHSDIAYYKTTNHCKSYRLVEISRTVSDETQATNFFSKFGSKFRINMREFGDIVPEIKTPSAFDASLSEYLSYMMKSEARKLMTQDAPENFKEEYSVFNHVTPYNRDKFPRIFVRR